MSQWTHVAAIFRLNSFGRIEDDVITKIFGKEVPYENMNDSYFDDNGNQADKDKYLPLGSEGSLDISIWHNPSKSSLASTTVSVFGDLRDYDSFTDIEKWFNKCCNSAWIRQAVCTVNVEFLGTKVFNYDDADV